MFALEPGDALGRGQKAHEADVAGAAVLEQGRAGASRVAGRQHRIHQDHGAVGQVLRRLEVIFHGLQRFGVAVEPDMGDARRGHQRQHAVEEADAGAQDRRQRELLAGDLRRLHGRDRRLDLDQLERQVARHLVAEQHPDLVEDLAKALGRAVLLPHQGELVLDQGVGDDVDAACAHETDLHGSVKLRQIGKYF
ncbi:hypothetical protein AB7M17_003724 [Bradyrhizobium sp. USDA 377]